jgi:hypothetical protein
MSSYGECLLDPWLKLPIYTNFLLSLIIYLDYGEALPFNGGELIYV